MLRSRQFGGVNTVGANSLNACSINMLLRVKFSILKAIVALICALLAGSCRQDPFGKYCLVKASFALILPVRASL